MNKKSYVCILSVLVGFLGFCSSFVGIIFAVNAAACLISGENKLLLHISFGSVGELFIGEGLIATLLIIALITVITIIIGITGKKEFCKTVFF